MSVDNLNLAQFGITNEVVDTLQDQSKETVGRESILLKPEAAGKCALRFVGYIETGTHTSKASGKAPAKTAQNVILQFEVVTPRHTQTKQDDKGEDYIIRDTMTVRLRKGSNPKSGFMNYFKRMDYGRGKTHMIQMLGEAFVGEILHTLDENGKDVKYANLHDGEAGVYTIGAPVVIDPMTNESTKLNIPEAKGKLRCFLWDNANQAMWDSLYFKEDKSEESWLHETIRKAEDFPTSAAAALLGGVDSLPAGTGSAGEVGAKPDAAKSTAALDALGGL